MMAFGFYIVFYLVMYLPFHCFEMFERQSPIRWAIRAALHRPLARRCLGKVIPCTGTVVSFLRNSAPSCTSQRPATTLLAAQAHRAVPHSACAQQHF